MAKILIIDSYYPDFLNSFKFDPSATYEQELERLLAMQFGTADFVSRSLRSLGWEAADVIANAPIKGKAPFYPDVLFFQDLHLIDKGEHNKGKYLLAGQLSCPWPGDERVRQFDVLFTSFPHYISRIEKLGVRAVYNPLAFDPATTHFHVNKQAAENYLKAQAVVDDYVEKLDHAIGTADKKIARLLIQNELKAAERTYGCVFVGGVGNPSHWASGMKTLEAMAREMPIGQFKWWGYGLNTLRENSSLRGTYQGEAWGRDMYDILLRSKIVINRHGEVAEGFANNMRMYEATGCGAMLLTDNDTDLFASDEIVRYSSPADCFMKAKYYLEHEDERAAIAARGQARTLRDHTYAQRMKVVSQVLTEMLCPA